MMVVWEVVTVVVVVVMMVVEVMTEVVVVVTVATLHWAGCQYKLRLRSRDEPTYQD
jgi:hypothetical protein